MSVTRAEICEAIQAIGVRSGELLIAHSSFRSFGGVEGGPEAVAGALIDVVQPGGSIFMPTFNYGELAYDARTTRSLTGAITEAFHQLLGVSRSLHPTHPVAGFGPNVQEILRDHDKVHAFGRGSPLGRLRERDAWVLLIGCDHRANSMIHVAEELVGVPYLNRTRIGRVIRNGIESTIEVRRPGCSESFNVVDALLREASAIFDGNVGASRIMLMRSKMLVETVAQMLRQDPAALLCPPGHCDVCDEARQML